MTGILPGVADAVVAALNAGTFSQSFTAARSYAGWRLKLETLDGLRVDVVPAEYADTALASQGTDEAVCRVDVVVRKKLDPSDSSSGVATNAAVDPLVALVEEIARFFMDSDERRLDDYTDAAWRDARVLWPYVPQHLPTQFTGVVRLGFDVAGDL